MQLFIEILSSALILLGTVFMIISAIGLIRLPDFYIRNSASTKATTLGLGLILLGIGIYFNRFQVFMEITAILFFILLISPLAAHIIARAAYKTKVPFWKKTNLKEMEGNTGDSTPEKDEPN